MVIIKYPFLSSQESVLEARSIETLGQAARISKRMMEQRRQEAQLK